MKTFKGLDDKQRTLAGKYIKWIQMKEQKMRGWKIRRRKMYQEEIICWLFCTFRVSVVFSETALRLNRVHMEI